MKQFECNKGTIQHLYDFQFVLSCSFHLMLPMFYDTKKIKFVKAVKIGEHI